MQHNSGTRRVTVKNAHGLHARPAHMLVTAATKYESEIQVIRNGESADGKSILSLLMLCAERGTELTLRATGGDSEEALAELEHLFLDGFGEKGKNGTVGPDATPQSNTE